MANHCNYCCTGCRWLGLYRGRCAVSNCQHTCIPALGAHSSACSPALAGDGNADTHGCSNRVGDGLTRVDFNGNADSERRDIDIYGSFDRNPKSHGN